MGITYSAPTITVTGYTEAIPCTFTDVYNADKAGSLRLKAPTAAAMDLSLTTQPRPTDKTALKLNLIISGFSVAGNITLTGKDKDNAVQSEVVDITGAGTFVTTKWWLSIDAAGVDCTGTYTVEVTQSQWGVVWKTGTTQFLFDCLLRVGDGSTATYLGDSLKQVVFSSGIKTANGLSSIYVRNMGQARFGILEDITSKRTIDGISFIDLEATYFGNIVRPESNSATIYIYSCLFFSNSEQWIQGQRMWNIVCHGWAYPFFNTITIADVHNLIVSGRYQGIRRPYPDVTINNLFITTTSSVLWFEIYSGTIKNVWIADVAGAKIRVQDTTTNNHYLINVAWKSVWTFTWAGVNTGNLYRQYTWNTLIKDDAGLPIQNANVTLYRADGTPAFTALTAADGTITEQTVSRGYYQQATGNTLQDYGPFTLKITKGGRKYEVKQIVLDKPVDWRLTLPNLTQPQGSLLVSPRLGVRNVIA